MLIRSNRHFGKYWLGLLLSEIGTRGTTAAVLYHVYDITGSSLQVGFVGVAQAIALFIASPLGGGVADRVDRKRLLQIAQLFSLCVSLSLAILTLVGGIEVWQILIAVALNTLAVAFERPARDSLIPVLVKRDELVRAFALINPSREVAILLGPTVAGFLIALWGPGAVYIVDAASYAIIIVALQMIRVPAAAHNSLHTSFWTSVAEGFSFIRRKPLIVQLISLDISAMVFCSYRVLLPAIATDILGVGPVGYGTLSAVPSAGALVGSAVIYRLADTIRSGYLVLAATAGYGFMGVGLGMTGVLQGGAFAVALMATFGLGFFDAVATTVRHAAVQLETPDSIRGRVTSVYQMASRGGPALGNLNVGWLATALSASSALIIGGLVPLGFASLLSLSRFGARIRRYQVEEHRGN